MHSLSAAPSRVAVAMIVALAAACGSAKPSGKKPRTGIAPAGDVQHGLASWYTDGMTASGERYDRHALTAAHRSFRMGTFVRVTNQRNGRSVVVRINDRGPFIRGRIIDVSEAAAVRLGMKEAGVVPVKVERLR